MLVAAQRARRAARAERHAGLAGRDPADAPWRRARGTPGARHAHSSKSSPPAAASSHGSTPSCAATSATPGASGSASRSIVDRHAAARREMARVGGQAVGEVDHRAGAERAPARGPRPGAARGAGRRARASSRAPRAAVEHGQPRGRGSQRAGHHDDVAGPRAVAPDELLARVRPAGDGDRERQHGARTRSPPAIVVAGARRQRLHRAHAVEHRLGAEARRARPSPRRPRRPRRPSRPGRRARRPAPGGRRRPP